jgi:hypothetical protein
MKITTSKYCDPNTIMYVYEPTPLPIYPVYPTTYPVYPTTVSTQVIYNVEVSDWFNALGGGLASSAQLSGAQGVSQWLGAQAQGYGSITASGVARQQAQAQYQYNYQYNYQCINGLAGLSSDYYSNIVGGIVVGGIAQAPETAAEKATRLKLEAEKEAKRKAASMRAEHLLFTILTPKQVRQYTDDDFIELVIKGRMYRVRKGYSRNIDLIENGKPVARYCAHPENAYHTPVPDAMLAQILMLQTNEAEFLKVANRTVLQ